MMATAGLKKPLLDYQAVGAERAVRERGLHLSMEMGTGKTPTSIGAVVGALCQDVLPNPARILLVAPVSILGQWGEEIAKFWPDEVPVRVDLVESAQDLGRWRYTSGGLYKQMTTLYLIGYERLEGIFESLCPEAAENRHAFRAGAYIEDLPEDLRFDAVVLDEATKIKNPKALATRVCLNLGRSAGLRLALSGTPMPNGPEDALAQIEFVRPGALREEGLSLHSKVDDPLSRARLKRLLERCAYRVTKAECLGLPAKSFIRREVRLTDEQEQLYYAANRELAFEVEDLRRKGRVWLPNVLAKLQACQQIIAGFVPWRTEIPDVSPELAARLFAAKVAERPLRLKKNPKGEEILAILEEAGDARVVVFCKFIEEIRLIAEMVARETGRPAMEYHGGVDPASRDATIRAFKQDRKSVLCIQERTGGFGLNLVEANLAIYSTNDWSWGVYAQSQDRIHRIGQSLPCTYFQIVAKGTVDERVLRAVEQKREIAEALLDT